MEVPYPCEQGPWHDGLLPDDAGLLLVYKELKVSYHTVGFTMSRIWVYRV